MNRGAIVLCLAGVLASSFSVGCGGAPDSRDDDANLAQVVLALSNVPSTITCVQITVQAAGQPPAPVLLTVTPGASSSALSVGRLPVGPATFSGAAFAAACTSVTSTTTPLWIADPRPVTLIEGANNTVELTFRENRPVTVNANFIKDVTRLAVGDAVTYGAMADGTLKYWGNPTIGASGTSILPTDLAGASSVADVVAGQSFSCLRTTAGAVQCWGVTPPAVNTVSTPTAVSLSGTVLQVAVGTAHACALIRNGTSPNTSLWCWGSNASGQLGNNSFTSTATPVSVQLPNQGSPAFVAAGGNSTCAISTMGVVSCWGANGNGQLGDTTIGTTRATPFELPTTSLVATVQLSLGETHACALKADGTVRCWGNDSTGQVGDGTAISTTPRAIVQLSGLTGAVEVAAGARHTCARRSNGTVACWGVDTQGQLADPAGFIRTAPFTIPDLPEGDVTVTSIAMHEGEHSCALMSDSSVRCWGANTQGQLGDGTVTPRYEPTPVFMQ